VRQIFAPAKSAFPPSMAVNPPGSIKNHHSDF